MIWQRFAKNSSKVAWTVDIPCMKHRIGIKEDSYVIATALSLPHISPHKDMVVKDIDATQVSNAHELGRARREDAAEDAQERPRGGNLGSGRNLFRSSRTHHQSIAVDCVTVGMMD
jgi:hypothetical protein